MFNNKLKKIGCSISFVLVLTGIFSGCSNMSLKDNNSSPSARTATVVNESVPVSPPPPAWINSLVKDLNSMPVKDSPESIVEYNYKGQIVYYFAPACCGPTQMSKLYDHQKNLLCKPDGGEDGKGDGKCPGFIAEKINEKLIWSENRD